MGESRPSSAASVSARAAIDGAKGHDTLDIEASHPLPLLSVTIIYKQYEVMSGCSVMDRYVTDASF